MTGNEPLLTLLTTAKLSYVYTGPVPNADPVRKLDRIGLPFTQDRSGTGP